MNIELQPMTAAEFETFLNRNVSRYAQELLITKQTEVEAHAMAEAQGAMNEVLPQGLETPLNYILIARDEDGRAVGEVWCDTTEPDTVFLNDLYVYTKNRKQGVGAAIVAAVEQIAEKGDFGRIQTHVYHGNKAAAALFAKRGYFPVAGETEGTLILEKTYRA